MSLYNLINGVNPATFFVLPMLGQKHPDEYPRFRDCFVSENNTILLLTRVGGGNREDYAVEIANLMSHPNYIRNEDEDWDSTFATFEFSVPDEWKADFDLIMNNKIKEISQAYKQRLYDTFPKAKEKFDLIFH